MNSTTSRTPFQSTAIAVALASSLFALTACGGGGDSSPASGSAGVASGGGATVVASNTGGAGAVSAGGVLDNGTQQTQGAAGGGTQQAQGAAGGDTQQVPGAEDDDHATWAARFGLQGSVGPSNNGAQAAALNGQGIGTEFARRIHAACPTFDLAAKGGWNTEAGVASILSCIAGNYAGTDLWTGQRCEVSIATNGDIRASRAGRAFRPFSVSSGGHYLWKDGAFYVELGTKQRAVADSSYLEYETVAVYFDPADALTVRKLALEAWSEDPETVRLIQKKGDYFMVEVMHNAEEGTMDDVIWCAIPR